MAQTQYKLYGFWRSLATYRVRIAMALKGIGWSEQAIDLLQGHHLGADFKGLNPQAMLPVLDSGAGLITQSLAILEYLDEVHPRPPLLPSDPLARAQARSFALVSIADSHPLIVPRVRRHLAETFHADAAQVEAWGRHWLQQGLEAMEARLEGRRQGRGEGARFCFGDAPGLADIALASHVAGARIFGCSFDAVPGVMAVADHCMALDAFSATGPAALKPD